MKNIPNVFQKATLWTAITAVSITIIGALLVGLIYLTTRVIAFLQPILIPFAVAGVLAYLLDPVVSGLVKRGLSRFMAVWLVFLTVMLTIVGISFIIVPAFAKQSVEFTSEIPAYSNKARQNITKVAYEWNAKLKKEWGWDLLHWEIPSEKMAPSRLNPPAAKESAPPEPVAPTPEAFTEFPLTPDAPLDVEPLLLESDSAATRDMFTLQDLLNGDWLKEMLPEIGQRLWNFIRSSVGGFLGVFGFFLSMVIVPLYLYYFLTEGPKINNSWMNYVPLRASSFKDEVVTTLTEINQYLIAFFRGQLVVSLINGVATGIGLVIVGLKFGWLIGLSLCLLGIIPYLGIIVTWIPAVIIASVQGGSYLIPETAPWWVYPLVVTGIFAVVQQIDGLFITPKIVGESVGLHPMTVIISVFAWSLVMGGLLGAILAVPLTAALKVLFTRYVWNRAKKHDSRRINEENDSVFSEAPGNAAD